MKSGLLISVFLLVFGVSAHAEILQQFRPFSTAGTPVQSDVFTFDPFNPSLGTLDRVIFNIQGQVIASATATPNLLPIGPAGSPAPVPYDYFLNMEMDIFSLAGFNFDFETNAKFLFSGVTITGAETSIPPQFNIFSLTTEFTELTDLLGFDLPTIGGSYISPTSVIGTRSDFEENPVTSSIGLQFQMLNIWTATDSGETAVLTPNGNTGGLVTLTYDYTPSPIPLPAAAWLFGTALIGLVGFSGRRRSI